MLHTCVLVKRQTLSVEGQQVAARPPAGYATDSEHICQASTNFIFDEMCGRPIGLPSMALSRAAALVSSFLRKHLR